MDEVDIVYVRAGGQGWGPVDVLVDLCQRLLPTRKVLTLSDRGNVHLIRKAISSMGSPRRGDRAALVVASSPAHLAYAARRAQWWPGYGVTAAWVIDSFWTDRISRFARHRGHLDTIFITDKDLQEEWSSATGSEVEWLPWGTDSLAAGTSPSQTWPVDVLRIGRQPTAWDDDALTRSRAEVLGLTMEGRPPMSEDSRVNQANVRQALTRAKFVLAFSNLVSPAEYTHPTRDYLTGRWMDALAAGATVAGSAPRSTSYTLWPGATLEIDPEDQHLGLQQIQEALAHWSPDTARRNQLLAQRTLDWRWRIREIADRLELSPQQALSTELAVLGGSP